MFLSTCRKLCTPLFARPRRPARHQSFRLRVEGLEDRTVLAPTLSSAGVLTIPGSLLDETIQVAFDNGSLPWTPYDDRVVVTVDYWGSHNVYYFAKWEYGSSGWQRNVTEIVYYGGSGSNHFGNATDIDSTAYGGNDGNQFLGGSGNDTFYGGGGTDSLYGGGGDDWLYGRGWTDHLFGEGGNDHLYGEGGIDNLHGGSGGDYLNGGFDGLPDQLTGGSGNDTFVAEYYIDVSDGLGVRKNRDQPSDFGVGDQIVEFP
jgi:Ca2+-binding RTX toxin-like protein